MDQKFVTPQAERCRFLKLTIFCGPEKKSIFYRNAIFLVQASELDCPFNLFTKIELFEMRLLFGRIIMEITKPCLSVTYKWKSLYDISKIGFQSKYGGDQIISMGYLFNLVNLLCKNNILPKFVQIQNKKMGRYVILYKFWSPKATTFICIKRKD